MNLRRSPVWPAATVALAVLTLVTAMSCRRVFADWEFFPLLFSVTIAVHALMALSRMFNIPLLVATPVAMLVTGAIIGRRMYPDSIRLGFLPTRSTWDLAWIDLRDAWRQFDTAAAPVPSTGGFLLAAALAIGVAAYAADTFGFRAFGRVEAVIPSGVVYTFVAALGVQSETGAIQYSRIWSGVIWLFTACVCVALLRSAHGDIGNTWLGGRRRERTLRIAATAGALSLITVGVAFAIAPRLPGAGATALIDPGGDTAGDVRVLSPIVDIKARLVNRSNRVMFRVESEQSNYWHLMSLTEFDGETWTSSERFSEAEGELDAEVPSGGDILEQTFTIDQMGGGWLPAATEAVGIDKNPADEIVYSAATSTLRVAGDGALYSGMTYEITSVLPQFSADALRSATSAAPPDEAYLQLPDDFPDKLRRKAEEMVAGATTGYDKAMAMQSFFQQFEYDINVPRGHSDSAIETFMDQRRGYCEQFAGTFAAFGRSLGLPTRVAIGFTPGVKDDDGEFVVRGRNAHAWPEVWFDGLGWVLFEPTPGRGAPGTEGYTGLLPAQDETVAPDTGGGAAAPVNDRDAAVASVPRETAPPGNGDLGPNAIPGLGEDGTQLAEKPPKSGSFPVTLAVVVGILVLMAAWLWLVPRIVAHRARRRHGRSPADRVSNAYLEADKALDLIGVGRRESETPLEHAYRAWKMTGIDRDSLRWLANAATRAVYASDTLDEATAHESERIRGDVTDRVRARASWTTRLRAHLDPRTAAALY